MTRRRSQMAGACLVIALGCSHIGAQDAETGSAPTTSTNTSTLDPLGVPTGKAGSPRGGVTEPASINGSDPDAIATAFAAVAYRYDTRLDASPMDATRRGKPWLTPAYAAQVSQPLPGGGGADWNALAAHDGYTTATVATGHDVGAPSDDATHADRQRVVTVTYHGSGGWAAPEQIHTLFISMNRPDPSAPWQISGVTTA